MIARNPKTGGQIRIMKSEAHIWKNSKTLLWVKERYTSEMKSLKRWDTIVVGLELMDWDPYMVVLSVLISAYTFKKHLRLHIDVQ